MRGLDDGPGIVARILRTYAACSREGLRILCLCLCDAGRLEPLRTDRVRVRGDGSREDDPGLLPFEFVLQKGLRDSRRWLGSSDLRRETLLPLLLMGRASLSV